MQPFTPCELPDLPYDFNALEPVISASIMELHYTKHHKGYVTNFNTALEKFYEMQQKMSLQAMMSLLSTLNFNGGGHINHSLFWTSLAPEKSGGTPHGDFADAIQQEFGSLQNLIEQFTVLTSAIQGSGWGWLGYSKTNKTLELVTCANQDALSTKGLEPLLGIDVWEHAYYLQYKNDRRKYLDNIWKIINWKTVEERYKKLHN